MPLALSHLLSATAVSGVLLVAACEGPIDVDATGDMVQGLAADLPPADRPPPPPGPCRPPLTTEAAAQAPGPHAHGARRRPPPDGRGPPPPHHRHGPGARLLAVYDDDDDGALDDAEAAVRDADLAAACTQRNAEAIAAFDTDGDALLNVEEWAAARAAHHAEHRAAHEARVGTAGPVDDEPTLATWDADSDGVLSPTERAALRKTLRTMVREGLHLPRLPATLTTIALEERATVAE